MRYAKGITSSREIEWCRNTNIIFKALSRDTVPHFTTIAGFVSSHPRAIENLFEQVLLICHDQGLLGNELFANDGCKMRSNAAKEHSGTFKELGEKRDKLRRKIRYHLKEHQKLDKYETKDEARQKRIEQTIETLDKASERIDHFLKTQSPRMGKRKKPTEVKSNITDNESAKMTTSKGTIKGYNGVAAVDKKHQIVVDAQVFGEGSEHHTLAPVLESIESRFKRLGIAENIYETGTGKTKAWFEGRLLQCRHCDLKHQCMKNPSAADHRKGAGRQVSFMLEAQRKPNYTDWMKRRVDSTYGMQVYSHRMSVVEPVFGNIGTNKKLSRFSLCGKTKVHGQWQLYCMVHNIEKIMRYGKMAA